MTLKHNWIVQHGIEICTGGPTFCWYGFWDGVLWDLHQLDILPTCRVISCPHWFILGDHSIKMLYDCGAALYQHTLKRTTWTRFYISPFHRPTDVLCLWAFLDCFFQTTRCNFHADHYQYHSHYSSLHFYGYFDATSCSLDLNCPIPQISFKSTFDCK